MSFEEILEQGHQYRFNKEQQAAKKCFETALELSQSSEDVRRVMDAFFKILMPQEEYVLLEELLEKYRGDLDRVVYRDMKNTIHKRKGDIALIVKNAIAKLMKDEPQDKKDLELRQAVNALKKVNTDEGDQGVINLYLSACQFGLDKVSDLDAFKKTMEDRRIRRMIKTFNSGSEDPNIAARIISCVDEFSNNNEFTKSLHLLFRLDSEMKSLAILKYEWKIYKYLGLNNLYLASFKNYYTQADQLMKDELYLEEEAFFKDRNLKLQECVHGNYRFEQSIIPEMINKEIFNFFYIALCNPGLINRKKALLLDVLRGILQDDANDDLYLEILSERTLLDTHNFSLEKTLEILLELGKVYLLERIFRQLLVGQTSEKIKMLIYNKYFMYLYNNARYECLEKLIKAFDNLYGIDDHSPYKKVTIAISRGKLTMMDMVQTNYPQWLKQELSSEMTQKDCFAKRRCLFLNGWQNKEGMDNDEWNEVKSLCNDKIRQMASLADEAYFEKKMDILEAILANNRDVLLSIYHELFITYGLWSSYLEHYTYIEKTLLKSTADYYLLGQYIGKVTNDTDAVITYTEKGLNDPKYPSKRKELLRRLLSTSYEQRGDLDKSISLMEPIRYVNETYYKRHRSLLIKSNDMKRYYDAFMELNSYYNDFSNKVKIDVVEKYKLYDSGYSKIIMGLMTSDYAEEVYETCWRHLNKNPLITEALIIRIAMKLKDIFVVSYYDVDVLREERSLYLDDLFESSLALLLDDPNAYIDTVTTPEYLFEKIHKYISYIPSLRKKVAVDTFWNQYAATKRDAITSLKPLVYFNYIFPSDWNFVRALATNLGKVALEEYEEKFGDGESIEYEIMNASYVLYEVAAERMQSDSYWRALLSYLDNDASAQRYLNTYYLRAYVYAKLMLNDAFSRMSPDDYKKNIDDFIWLSKMIGRKPYYSEKNTDSLEKTKNTFIELLKHPILSENTKLNSFVEKLVDSIEGNFMITEINWDIEGGKDQLLMMLYRDEIKSSRDVLDDLPYAQIEGDSFFKCVDYYLKKIENGQQINNEFLYQLNIPLRYQDYRLREYAKKLIQESKFVEGLENFKYLSLNYPFSGVVIFYNTVFECYTGSCDEDYSNFNIAFKRIMNILKGYFDKGKSSADDVSDVMELILYLLNDCIYYSLIFDIDPKVSAEIIEDLKKTYLSLKSQIMLKVGTFKKIKVSNFRLSEIFRRKDKLIEAINYAVLAGNFKEENSKYIEDFMSRSIYYFEEKYETIEESADIDLYFEGLFTLFSKEWFRKIVEIIDSVKFRNVLLRTIVKNHMYLADYDWIEDYDVSFLMDTSFQDIQIAEDWDEYIHYLKDVALNHQRVEYEKVKKYFEMGCFLFGIDAISNFFVSRIGRFDVEATLKHHVLQYFSEKIGDEMTYLMFGNFLFETEQYPEALEQFKKVSWKKFQLKQHQPFRNNYLITRMIVDVDYTVFNIGHEPIKSVMRKLHWESSDYDARKGKELERLRELKGLVFTKLEKFNNPVLLSAWYINKYLIPNSAHTNYDFAETIALGLATKNSYISSYYLNKISQYKQEYKVGESVMLRGVEDNIFCGFDYLETQYSNTLCNIFDAYPDEQLNQIIRASKTSDFQYDEEVIVQAYVQKINMIEDDKSRTRLALDYLSYLLSRYHWNGVEELSQLYIEGYDYMESAVDDYSRSVNVKFFNQSLMRIMSHFDSFEEMGRLLEIEGFFRQVLKNETKWGQLLVSLKGYNNFSANKKLMLLSQFIKAISEEVLSDIFEDARQDVVEMIQDDIAKLYDIQLARQHIDYFISYSRRDYGKVVELKQALEDQHQVVWFDVDNLEMGRFRNQILSAIYKSDVVLFMMSQNVFDKIESIYELEFVPAIDLKKAVLPVWVGDKKWSLDDIEKKYEADKENKNYKRLLEYYIGVKGEEAVSYDVDASVMCEKILNKSNKK